MFANGTDKKYIDKLGAYKRNQIGMKKDEEKEKFKREEKDEKDD